MAAANTYSLGHGGRRVDKGKTGQLRRSQPDRVFFAENGELSISRILSCASSAHARCCPPSISSCLPVGSDKRSVRASVRNYFCRGAACLFVFTRGWAQGHSSAPPPGCLQFTRTPTPYPPTFVRNPGKQSLYSESALSCPLYLAPCFIFILFSLPQASTPSD